VIGGVTPACTEVGAAYYGRVMDTVVSVSSTRVAEMVKLLENTFRMINIGLANEMALMCDRMGIDVWEVIEAAATKPFGFMPFYPGPMRADELPTKLQPMRAFTRTPPHREKPLSPIARA
jgi:UDP-N-acetyl-D-glucosamine dehydrogenase